jgi:hypothetical protein
LFRAEISQLIHTLRQKRGGSLSGMTMEDIIQKFAELIVSQDHPQPGTTEIQEQPTVQQVKHFITGFKLYSDRLFYTLNFVLDICLKLQEISIRNYLSVSKTYLGSITQFDKLLYHLV